ncbi:MAG TPA: response regulator transcription factor [Dehalococcoidia bacterium]|nr:response regulator transcription factor [Dehalococcoidia bacterium]
MSPIRVLLVDDQLLFRKGLRALLEDQQDFQVVGEAADGAQALERVRATTPDVVLMDIHMPVCGGAEATRLIKGERPATKVVALTVSDEDEDLFEAIKSGADGYLLKDLRPEELFDLLHGVLNGETPISPAVAGKLLTEFRRRPWREPSQGVGWDLTARELEILRFVAAGLSNAEIAARLYIVEGTVKNHLHNILEKLHLENRVQAATYAIREGLVEPPNSRSGPGG